MQIAAYERAGDKLEKFGFLLKGNLQELARAASQPAVKIAVQQRSKPQHSAAKNTVLNVSPTAAGLRDPLWPLRWPQSRHPQDFGRGDKGETIPACHRRGCRQLPEESHQAYGRQEGR